MEAMVVNVTNELLSGCVWWWFKQFKQFTAKQLLFENSLRYLFYTHEMTMEC